MAVMRTFEFDDYPDGGERMLAVLDRLHERWPAFRACVFAVPLCMRPKHWRPLLDRSAWLRVYPHGFEHRKGECRGNPGDWVSHLRTLDAIAAEGRWGTVFKAPWYGHDQLFAEACHDRLLSIAAKSLQGFDYPLLGNLRTWNVRDAEWSTYDGTTRDHTRHVVAHPVDGRWERNKTRHTEISETNIAKWTSTWHDDDTWTWLEPLVRPALVKINLACGPAQVWDGWDCYDARDFPGVRRWQWGELLPYGDCRADVVFCSHSFNYMEESQYAAAALEVWRVLRPGGVWRLSEDDTDSGYVWRTPGRGSRGTGAIRSLPTRSKIRAALERVGFEVHVAAPNVTRSPHVDVLRGDTRSRRYRQGHKFYLEAVKNIHIPKLGRTRYYDPRATRSGYYRLPEATTK